MNNTPLLAGVQQQQQQQRPQNDDSTTKHDDSCWKGHDEEDMEMPMRDDDNTINDAHAIDVIDDELRPATTTATTRRRFVFVAVVAFVVLLLFCQVVSLLQPDNNHYYYYSDGARSTSTPTKYSSKNEPSSFFWLLDFFQLEQEAEEISSKRRRRHHDHDHDHRVSSSPTQIHLAYTNNPSVMLVQFTTTTGEAVGNSVVGKSPVALYGHDSLQTKVEGITTTYAASDMCGAPANRSSSGTTSRHLQLSPPGELHTIALTNLQPNTNYNYKVGLPFGQGIVWSTVDSFVSAPTATSSSSIGDDDRTTTTTTTNTNHDYLKNYTYAVYGGGAQNVLNYGFDDDDDHYSDSNSNNIRAVHILGNLANAKGDAQVWDDWMTHTTDQAFAGRIPIMVVIGNQDYDYVHGDVEKDPSGVVGAPYHPSFWGDGFRHDASGGECGVPVSKRFTMPDDDDDDGSSGKNNGVFWYAYSVATVHTIVLSSEHDLSKGSPQYDFLKSSINNNKTSSSSTPPWTVVEIHRPLYNALQGHWKDNAVGIALRMEIEDLLVDGGVDLVLSGHYPSYSRSCAGLYKSQCDSGGPTHITVGGGGRGGRGSHDNNNDNNPSTTYTNQWTKKTIVGEVGYGRITVNATDLLFEYVRAGDNEKGEDDADDGAVLDKVRLKKI
jgi:hypothetical protein